MKRAELGSETMMILPISILSISITICCARCCWRERGETYQLFHLDAGLRECGSGEQANVIHLYSEHPLIRN